MKVTHPGSVGGVSGALAAAVWLGLAPPAPAADITVCYPRDQMLRFIGREYAADKRATGIVRPYSVMELWVSDRTGDWLMVTTDIYGSSCIIGHGEDFALAAPPGHAAAQVPEEEPSSLRLP